MTVHATPPGDEPKDSIGVADESPVRCRKFGHYVYEVADIQRSVKFWTEVMNFRVSDRNARGMVFLRCNADHHGIGLTPGKSDRRASDGNTVDHLALEVDSMEVLFRARDYFRKHGIPIVFEGRRGAGCNTSVNFLDPDGYEFEIYVRMDQVIDDRLRPEAQFRPARSLEEAVAYPLPESW
jgi:catechol 2,3-dioxygenase-like lactoylglutathione lyase family enzyme